MPSEGTLIAESKSVEAGGSVWVGLRVTMKPKWHIYWKNPGDSGVAPTLKWTLPDGVKLTTPAWPAPHRVWLDPLMMYGYGDEVLFAVEVRVPKEYKAKTLRIGLEASWLVCDEVYLDERLEQEIEIPVRSGAPAKHAKWAPLFARTRAATPKTVKNAFVMGGNRDPDERMIALGIRTKLVPIDKESRVYFFPAKGEVLDHTADQALIRIDGSTMLMLTPAATLKNNQIQRLRGVLVVEQGKQRRAYLVDAPPLKPVFGRD